MTTAGSNGTPESAGDDDPFAYLYRPAEGETAPKPQPRSGYSRPMEVGRAQYGAPAAPTQQYQSAPPTAPTTPVPQQTRYAERSRPQPGEERPSGGRGKAAVIGAIAVIAAIAIGAGIALSNGDAGKPDAAASTHASAPAGAPATAGSAAPSSSGSPSPTADTNPVADASKLQGQNAPAGNSVKGAISADGSYLTLQPGSSVTWTISVPTAGQYKLWFHYNNTGAEMPASVTANGKDHQGGVNFKVYSKAVDPEHSWTYTNVWPQLQAGPNTLTVTVPAGGSGTVLLDQVTLTDMSVSGDYPRR
ncbi:hypothetical protein AB0D08_26355 [Kitasatospora sp. NPDC048540]|uniref:hypothetical protein n=1 Tax=unclassified Kitasatospora TaxID=2633591 RepID=UPI00053B5AE1|nr:hypothetical protein [Kitasatospora sp. MBT63]